MSTLYAELAQTARELLQEFGQTVTLRKSTPGAYDVSTSSATLTEADTVGVGAVLPYKDSRRTIEREPGPVQTGMKRVLWRATSGTGVPAIGDFLIIGAETWSIVNADELSPAGVVVLYEIHVRK